MKAIRITEHGGPEVMRLEELPTPAPQAGQVLVRIEAAGVNYVDTYQRSGQYRVPLPYVMGLEGAGVVEAIGEGVSGIRVGARVAWAHVPGSYATHAVVPADKVVPLPDGITSQHGAAAMLQGMTAHYLARSTYPLKRGDTCLVHAGAGGVGLLLTQIARRAGARVFTTVSSDEKANGLDLDLRWRATPHFIARFRTARSGRCLPVLFATSRTIQSGCGARSVAAWRTLIRRQNGAW